MIKGFKDFILRGNVVDLAVAFVIGVAFASVVTAFTGNIVKPLINAVMPGNELGFGFHIINGNAATFVNIGAVITAIINFVLTAAVVYFVILVPINKLAALRKSGAEPEPESPGEDILLLTEIRDLLRGR